METPPAELTASDLQRRLPEVMLRDARRLQKRIDSARRTRDADKRTAVLTKVSAEIDRSTERLERRRAHAPRPSYPPALPVSQRRDDLLAAIRDSQVVVVAGETGSGKTTQLPKICLELGRGARGLIGHTQPRRIAARTVAERIAEELGTPLGDTVGYKVRFSDHVSPDTHVKLMTDGILLAEIQRDRLLSDYDTIIIDEAHERSLNIDFILGYLKQLLPRRPDLKVVITSATIDPERFSRHFDGAPVVQVSGRTYPVEVRYQPVDDGGDSDRDQVQAICDAVEELQFEGPGDILVFLSGQREIRDTADALKQLDLRATEILPLYARLSAAEQHRVFADHSGRRVVLATNVAETSLTVPGIRYVVDPGTARISRYSARTKVQRLPIEAISQASANQRKGRCGRVAEGICIRLYSEEDFEARPEFTDPEILRTNLASVILQMTSLGLGDIAAFPFVEPPDRRNIRDGVQLLQEIGAFSADENDPRKRLTPVGRQLAAFPIDPRLARMVIEADRNGCVREVLIIAAALSIQDVRERPSDKQQAADEKHARFADKESDFLSYLNLWRYLRDQQKELSSNQFRKLCRNEFLNYLRIREWQDLFNQLRQVVQSLDLAVTSSDDTSRVHMSLLAGLLSHIGLKEGDKNDYLGARNAKFAVFPGSYLFKKPPRWLMSAELVETSRLWARVNARIEPEWAEELGQHLVKRTYSEPHWEKDRAAVMAFEKVTLYGVPLVAARRVTYGRLDPELSRDLFIRNALVEGDWRTHHAFFHDNRRLLEEAEELEHRARRRDIVVGEEDLFEFYDRRIPAEIVSGRHFDSWWKKARREQPDLLTFSAAMLTNDAADEVQERDYPQIWRQGDVVLPLTYRFEPGTPDDGVTVHLPVEVLNRLADDDFGWQVPGFREELVTALIRSLPKPVRRHFAPAPNTAKEVLARLPERDGALLPALERELERMRGVPVARDDWQLDRIPEYLRMSFRVVGDDGHTLAEGKDLVALKKRLHKEVRAVIASAAASVEATGLRSWTVGTLPRTYEQHVGSHTVIGYPALVDEGDTVAVRILGTEAEQRQAMWAGTRRLLLLNVATPLKYALESLSTTSKLTLSSNPHGSVAALLDDVVTAAVDKLMYDASAPVWDVAAFGELHDAVRADLDDTVMDILGEVERVLSAAQAVDRQLRGITSLILLPSLTDARDCLNSLVFKGFVAATGAARLPDLTRYVRALEVRLQRLPDAASRDRTGMARVEEVQRAYDELLRALAPARRADTDVQHLRWMIEELRVSVFAQGTRTPYPVSEKRIYRAMDDIPE